MKTSVRERYEKEVTVDDVVAEANDIWTLFKKTFPRTAEHSQDSLTAFYNEMQCEHPQFANTYPIVMRYMCELGQFHPDALRKYLRFIQHHQWNSVDSYLESQAKYALILYKRLNPKYKMDDAQRYYDNVLKMLKNERKQFEADADAAKTEVDKNHERMKLRNAIELREFYAMYGKEAVAVPIRVVSDFTNDASGAIEKITSVAADDDIDQGGF